MIVYIDSSAALRILLSHPDRYEKIEQFQEVYALELLETECLRTLHRLRLTGKVDDDQFSELGKSLYGFLEELYIIPLTKTILRGAGQGFSNVIGTLDALHLVAAMELSYAHPKSPPKLLTHDIQLAKVASSVGMAVLGV